MRTTSILLVALFFGGVAFGQSLFKQQIADAAKVAATPEGKMYIKDLERAEFFNLNHLGAECRSDTSAYTIVGNISPIGRLVDLDVEPKTEGTLCHLKSMQSWPPSPLPPRSLGDRGFPFAISIKITP